MITDGGEDKWHCHLCVEPGSAAPLDLSKHPGALLSVVGCGRFPLKRVERDVTVQVNLEIVGLVSFLFCVLLFYHLPVAPLLLI